MSKQSLKVIREHPAPCTCTEKTEPGFLEHNPQCPSHGTSAVAPAPLDAYIALAPGAPTGLDKDGKVEWHDGEPDQPECMDDNILICGKHSITFTKESNECFVCTNREAASAAPKHDFSYGACSRCGGDGSFPCIVFPFEKSAAPSREQMERLVEWATLACDALPDQFLGLRVQGRDILTAWRKA